MREFWSVFLFTVRDWTLYKLFQNSIFKPIEPKKKRKKNTSNKKKQRRAQKRMNLAKVTVEELEVDDVYVGDVLKCLLNTIVFHRTLGDITPSDTECENIPELRYVSTSSIDVVFLSLTSCVALRCRFASRYQRD